MIIRRHGYDPDKEVVSVLSFFRVENILGPDISQHGYQVEYVINAPDVVVDIVADIFIDGNDLIIHTPENW